MSSNDGAQLPPRVLWKPPRSWKPPTFRPSPPLTFEDRVLALPETIRARILEHIIFSDWNGRHSYGDNISASLRAIGGRILQLPYCRFYIDEGSEGSFVKWLWSLSPLCRRQVETSLIFYPRHLVVGEKIWEAHPRVYREAKTSLRRLSWLLMHTVGVKDAFRWNAALRCRQSDSFDDDHGRCFGAFHDMHSSCTGTGEHIWGFMKSRDIYDEEWKAVRRAGTLAARVNALPRPLRHRILRHLIPAPRVDKTVRLRQLLHKLPLPIQVKIMTLTMQLVPNRFGNCMRSFKVDLVCGDEVQGMEIDLAMDEVIIDENYKPPYWLTISPHLRPLMQEYLKQTTFYFIGDSVDPALKWLKSLPRDVWKQARDVQLVIPEKLLKNAPNKPYSLQVAVAWLKDALVKFRSAGFPIPTSCIVMRVSRNGKKEYRHIAPKPGSNTSTKRLYKPVAQKGRNIRSHEAAFPLFSPFANNDYPNRCYRLTKDKFERKVSSPARPPKREADATHDSEYTERSKAIKTEVTQDFKGLPIFAPANLEQAEQIVINANGKKERSDLETREGDQASASNGAGTTKESQPDASRKLDLISVSTAATSPTSQTQTEIREENVAVVPPVCKSNSNPKASRLNPTAVTFKLGASTLNGSASEFRYESQLKKNKLEAETPATSQQAPTPEKSSVPIPKIQQQPAAEADDTAEHIFYHDTPFIIQEHEMSKWIDDLETWPHNMQVSITAIRLQRFSSSEGPMAFKEALSEAFEALQELKASLDRPGIVVQNATLFTNLSVEGASAGKKHGVEWWSYSQLKMMKDAFA